jgi:hypothetical protein
MQIGVIGPGRITDKPVDRRGGLLEPAARKAAE